MRYAGSYRGIRRREFSQPLVTPFQLTWYKAALSVRLEVTSSCYHRSDYGCATEARSLGDARRVFLVTSNFDLGLGLGCVKDFLRDRDRFAFRAPFVDYVNPRHLSFLLSVEYM